ncbi:MAG: sensor histidine kinase [Micrococcales bacterium]
MALAAKNGFGWSTLALAFIPGILSSIYFDRTRLGGGLVEWLTVGLAVYLLTVVLFLIAKLVKERFSPSAGWIYTFGTYLLIGWARGLFTFALTVSMGLAPESDLLYRLMGSPIYVFVTFITCTAVVTSVLEQRQATGKLIAEREVLEAAILNFRAKKERLQAELIGRVSGVLAPVIDDLNKKLERVKDPKTVKSAVASLQATVDQVIRPLSHTLAFDLSTLKLTQELSVRPKDKSILPNRVAVHLLPGWGALIILGNSVAPANINRDAPSAVMLVALATLLMYGLLQIFSLLFARLWVNPVVAGVLVISTYVLSGWAVPRAFQGTSWALDPMEVAAYPLLGAVVGVVIYIAGLANEIRDTSRAEIETVNNQMQLVRSQLRQQVWLEQRRVAQVLHGSVQGALYASAIKLARLESPDAQVINEVKTDIQKSLEQLSISHAADFSFTQVIESIVDLWKDSVEFDLELDDIAVAWLEKDADAAECVIEVVREAVNNAMRHAKATKISIRLAPQNSGLVLVTVANNGEALTGKSTPGYGSQMLNDITHKWSLETMGDETVLTALVALRPI